MSLAARDCRNKRPRQYLMYPSRFNPCLPHACSRLARFSLCPRLGVFRPGAAVATGQEIAG